MTAIAIGLSLIHRAPPVLVIHIPQHNRRSVLGDLQDAGRSLCTPHARLDPGLHFSPDLRETCRAWRNTCPSMCTVFAAKKSK